jgi:hypothetical protein
MTQNNRFLKSAGYVLVLSAIALSVSSCIDAMYDLSNGVSMDMVLGGDSLAIPIGSTDTIMLGDFLDTKTITMLKTMEDGGYAITIKDSVVPEIPVIDQSLLKIDDQVKTLSSPLNFGNINLDNFNIPGISKDVNVNLGLSTYSLGNFTIPSISANTTTPAGMSDYALKTPTIDDINVDASQNNILTSVSIPANPGGHVGVPIPDPDDITIGTSSKIETSVNAPSGVSDIGNVMLKDGAVFEVTIELAGASEIFKSGALIPNFTIDPDGLFVFTDQPTNGSISFTDKDSLTVANGFHKTKTFPINQLKISGSPIAGKIQISKDITVSGLMGMKNAVVWSDQLVNVKGLALTVSVAVKNLEINSMEFNIPTLDVAIPNNSTDLNINNSIPDQINGLNKILFNDPATITINLSTKDLPTMQNAAIKIKDLSITFPEQFVFEPMPGLSNNVYKITDETFNSDRGRNITLTLKELNMSQIPVVDGVLKWKGTIAYSGEVSFGGRINSKDIPVNDAKMVVDFGSSISFKSAEVRTNQISVSIPTVEMPISFPISIADMVKRLEVIKMKPGTTIKVDLKKPTLPLVFSANNMQVTFPSIFSFDPPLVANKLLLNGALPDSIVLVLDALNINQDLVDGQLTLDENIGISGGVDLLPGVVNSTEIESLTGKTMSIKASTSDLRISSTSIKLKDLNYPSPPDSIALNFPIPDVPKQLVALDSVLLKDNANIQLAVNIINMPDFGSDVNVDLVVDFPKMFLFAPGAVNSNNQMIINQAIVGGKLNKTIGIRGLKFDGHDLNGVLNINDQLKYTAGVSVLSPTVNSDDLIGKTITIQIEAKISNIAFKSVYGKLDPGLEPVSQTIPLDSIYKALKDNNIDVVLDVTKPVIAIKTECNLGIPIDANVKLTPMIGGSPVANAEQDITIKVPKSPSPDSLLKKTFWISPDDAGMPTGADFIQANVQNLFKKIPENVKMLATVTTDKTQQHFIDLTATYKFKLGYEVTIPLAFGEDLKIDISKDIDVGDPKIGEKAKSVGGIELLGTIENSIPLELNLAIVPLDENKLPISGIDTVRQIIKAGAHDGSSVLSPLTLKISDPQGNLANLRGFRLLFSASSNETVAGTPIKPENFVKANLKVRVDGGINIKDLVGNK